jgi:hypothetical protein
MEDEKYTASIEFLVKPSEKARLDQLANGRPLAAYLRERLDLCPAARGRRWPENPAERSWRTREIA